MVAPFVGGRMPGRSERLRTVLVMVVVLAGVLCAAYWLRIRRWIAIDTCMDRRGAWLEDESICSSPSGDYKILWNGRVVPP